MGKRVIKVETTQVSIPMYVRLGHRHFEKEQPVPFGTSTATYRVPTEMLYLGDGAEVDVLSEIEEVLVEYKQPGRP